MITEYAVAIVISYLLGGVCTGYYLVRFCRGIDIRDQGSGGVGARNVGRVLGRVGFYTTLIGDALKGAVPILAIRYMDRYMEFPQEMSSYLLVAVVVGNVWPLLLQFRGGRGIATAFGGYLALDWILGLTLVGAAILLLIFRRGVVLSGMAAFLLLPLVAVGIQSPRNVIVALVSVAVVVVVAHRHHLRGVSLREGK